MVTSAKSSVPTVTDQAAAMQLGQCAKNLATCLAELRTSAQKVEHRHTGIKGMLEVTVFYMQIHHSRDTMCCSMGKGIIKMQLYLTPSPYHMH